MKKGTNDVRLTVNFIWFRY